MSADEAPRQIPPKLLDSMLSVLDGLRDTASADADRLESRGVAHEFESGYVAGLAAALRIIRAFAEPLEREAAEK